MAETTRRELRALGGEAIPRTDAVAGPSERCTRPIKELVLPWPPSSLNPNKRLHWTKRSKSAKTYREACYMLTKQQGITVDWEGDIHAWIDFYPPDRRNRDDDNLVSSFKSGRDGIADALGVNDKRFRIHPYVKSEIGGMVKVRFTRGPNV